MEFVDVSIDTSKDYSQVVSNDWLNKTQEKWQKRTKKLTVEPIKQKMKKMKSFEEKKKVEEISEGPEPMMEEFESKVSESEDTFLEELKQPTQSPKLLSKKNIEIRTSLSRILDNIGKDIDFTLVSLPENFYDSYHGFIYKACDLCHERSSQNDLVLCMLCGMLMCTHVCGSSKDRKKSSRPFLT